MAAAEAPQKKKQNRLKTYCINPDNTNKNACVLHIGFYYKKKTQHLCVIQYAMYHSAQYMKDTNAN